MITEKTVDNKGEGSRLDVYIASAFDITRTHAKKLCEDNLVLLNGKTAKGKKIIASGDVVSVDIPEIKQTKIEPLDIPIDIVYQDEDIAVINKPQGLTVHAGNGTGNLTLVNALLYHLDNLSGINGELRPGIVHRIDKNTSGLLVVAKNDKAHLSLSKQISDKTCKRVYVALLEGNLKQDSGVIETYINRNEKDRTKMAVSSHGRKAVTEYKVLKRYEKYTLAEFSLKTGRTHQIRVHAKYLGHPVVGDKEYGYKNQKFNLNGQLLHAKTLSFIHPTKNIPVSFNAPLPEYFENVLKKLK